MVLEGISKILFSPSQDEDHNLHHQGSGSLTDSDHSGISERVQHTLNGKMVRERTTDHHKHYEVVDVLGVGTMGSVSRVRKKKKAVGGSARASNASLKPVHILRRAKSKASKRNIERSTSNQSTGDISHDGSSSNSPPSTPVPSDRSYEPVYALKTIHLERLSDPTFVEELRNEIEVLRNLDHPNIIRPIETYEHKKQMCIVMELCSGGDLYSRSPYTEREAQVIVKKLLSAVTYMHRCNFVHLDIKFENILFENDSPDAEIKLVDMGLSKKYSPDDPFLEGGAGTIYTMAPQVLDGSFTSQADIWSVGVVAFMLLSGKLPFFGKDRAEVTEKIKAAEYKMEGEVWNIVSPEAKDLVRSLLTVDRDVRPTGPEALRHPWFRKDFFEGGNYDHRASLVPRHVQESIERFACYSRIKKLALMIVAHKSTTEEIGFLRDAFEKYDMNHDGTIDLPDFKRSLAHFGYSDDDLQAMFRELDLDGSGFIHYTEFLAASMEAKGVITEERLAEAFDRLDSDDSGYISKKNLKAMLVDGFQGRAMSEALIEEIISEGDFFQDGRISYDEFLMLWDEQKCQQMEKIVGSPGPPSFVKKVSNLSWKSNGSVTTK